MKLFSGGITRPRGWVRIASAPDRMAAGMVEGLLKGADIPVIMQRPAVFPYMGAGGEHVILVPADREQEAREVLEGIWPLEEESDD